MNVAMTILEYYLGLGAFIVGAGFANDVIRHRKITGPFDSIFVLLFWPVLFAIVWNMWKRGDFE